MIVIVVVEQKIEREIYREPLQTPNLTIFFLSTNSKVRVTLPLFNDNQNCRNNNRSNGKKNLGVKKQTTKQYQYTKRPGERASNKAFFFNFDSSDPIQVQEG